MSYKTTQNIRKRMVFVDQGFLVEIALQLLDQHEESEVKARTRTGSCLMGITGTSRCAPDTD